MEGSVWVSWFVQAVTSLSNLSASLNAPQKLPNGGASPNALVKDTALSISTSKSATVLAVKRDPEMATADAFFGRMDYNGEFIGDTMERKAVAIPEGTYRGYKRDSMHFAMKVIGIDVPNRTNIECHPANLPSQLLGCIAVGESKDGDALDNSITAFQKMMAAVPEEFTVEVS